MSESVFFAVVFAALLHAAWNALVKGGADKVMSMGAVVLGQTLFALVVLPFLPLPATESLPYLAVGVLLHVGYQWFLLQSYRTGDLTHVYPIARGSAPLFVAAVSVLFLGVQLDGLALLAIATVVAGIMSLALVRQHNGPQNRKAALFALVTGMFIAAYSLVDGFGARLSGTSLGFYAWLAIANGGLMGLYLWQVAPQSLRAIPGPGRATLLLGGGASFVAYSLVMWAFTQAPIALVTALRETSIVFALLIGVFFLKERLSLLKVAATFTTLIGAALLRIART